MDRDTLLWVMSSLAVLVNAAVGVFNIDRTLDRDKTVSKRLDVQAELSNLLSDVKDAETGHRGYLLTGRDDYLEPFNQSRERIPDRLATLDALLLEQPSEAQVRHFGEMRRLIDAKLREMTRTLEIAARLGRPDAIQAMAQGEGKRIMDELRAVTQQALDAGATRLKLDQASALEQRWTALMTLVIGAVLSVGIIMSAAMILRVELARRQATLASLARAKDEVDTTLSRLDAFLMNVPAGISYFDQDLRYIRVNAVFAAVNGKSIEEHIGKTLREVAPDFPDDLAEDYRAVMRTRQPLSNRRAHYQGVVWDITAFPVVEGRGAQVGLGIIGVDVSEKFLAESRLRESESRFRTIAETMPQIVWMTRPDGYHEYFNSRWYDYTGLTPEESIGWGWSAPLHPDDLERSQARWKLSTDNGIPYEIEYRFRAADGGYRWFLARANAIRGDGGQVVRWLGTCTDIDDARRQAETLEELVADRTVALRRSNMELEKFAYIASHDLQEPLRKIQAFGDRLSLKFRDQVGEQGQDYIARMLDSSARMRRLIEDLLSFSRVTSTTVPLLSADLGKVVADVLSDLEVRLGESGGRVDVGPLPTVVGDAGQLRQLFQNLIGNALKFRRPGVPPEVSVRATDFADLPADADPPPPEGPGFRVAVSDNGIGFEPQYAGRIFELFQRLHGRHQYEGTGLGLAICKKIAERHGASVSARGRLGAGSQFLIDWPTA